MASGDLRRLAAAVEALELQVRQLTAEVRELAEREGTSEPPTGPAPVEDAAAEEPPVDEPADEPPAEPDLDAARIVALNMALDGRPRDEVAAYIRDELGVKDSGALLDDVYARVG